MDTQAIEDKGITSAVVQALTECREGDTITYEALTAIVRGKMNREPSLSEVQGVCFRAQQKILNSHVFECVQNTGYLRVGSVGALRAVDKRISKARRQTKRAGKTLNAVDVADLDAAQRTQFRYQQQGVEHMQEATRQAEQQIEKHRRTVLRIMPNGQLVDALAPQQG